MEKKMNNKGFSLVELIIVVAIMAVLIGVLAPTYLKYVESSKKTSDCSSIGSILDACEVLAIDPASSFDGDTISFAANADGKLVCSVGDSELKAITGCDGLELQGKWGTTGFSITCAVNSEGKVTFSSTTAPDFSSSSPALANRIN